MSEGRVRAVAAGEARVQRPANDNTYDNRDGQPVRRWTFRDDSEDAKGGSKVGLARVAHRRELLHKIAHLCEVFLGRQRAAVARADGAQ